MFDSRKRPGLALRDYCTVMTLTYGIHSSLADGIPSHRVVFWNSEPADTNGENVTDNISVGYAATPGATAQIAGVVKDGCGEAYSDLVLLPQSNQDFNVTVTLLGTEIVEVAPGEVIPLGLPINVDAEGRAAAAGDATTFVALDAIDGTGTADSPQFVTVLVR